MAKWHCDVCGYVHEGDAPPEQCPVCGADRNRFAPQDDPAENGPEETATPTDAPAEDRPNWQCSVCGTTRTGEVAPSPCPVCGAESTLFTQVADAPSGETAAPPAVEGTAGDQARWQCVICGYIHTGPEPPEKCPVCGADRSKFVLLEEPETDSPAETDAASEAEALPDDTTIATSFLDPYRRWIDLAIALHAHPIAVHIPNGVLPVTVVMVLLAAIFDWPLIGQASVYNMGFVFLSMPVVLFTGYLHWQYKFGGNMTDLFKWKIICGGVVFGLSFILFMWGLFAPESARNPGFLFLALHVILLTVAGIAGWLGGKLVFRA